MLDILKQIQDAIDESKPVSIYVGIDRFGYVRDGLNFPRGLLGFREWWAIEWCCRYLWKIGLIEFEYTGVIDSDTLHIMPKRKGNRK